MKTVRIALTGMTSFVVVVAAVAWLGAQAKYGLGWQSVDGYGKGRLETEEKAVVKELWIRGMIPLPLHRPCYTGNQYVCLLADAVSAMSDHTVLSSTWTVALGCSAALISSSLLIWVGRRKSIH